MAPPGHEVIMVSPWIGDVTLVPPMFKHSHETYERSTIQLGELLAFMAQDYHIQITLVLRELDNRFAHVVTNWHASPRIKIHIEPNLHAKAIVTNSFVLLGSANLLQTSLFRNVELCELKSNTYRSARRWLSAELGIQV